MQAHARYAQPKTACLAEQVQMIDCRDGKSVNWLTLAHFFAGYLHPWTRALCPDTFRKMMLKLKDWPPDQDFNSKMPECPTSHRPRVTLHQLHS